MIMLTGGSGLLGQELQKHIECVAPSHEEFDILNPPKPPKDTHLIVHCAAYTDVVKAEEDRNDCYDVNCAGTRLVARLGLPIVYISTEYVFGGGKGNYSTYDTPDPQNFYALTKLIGEGFCMRAPASLVIRTLFKPRPFEHARACTDQWTSGDYVDVIAPLIADKIRGFEGTNQGHFVCHVGTERKSTYELAKRSRPDVEPCLRSDIKSIKLPMDTSLNTTLWEKTW